MAENRHKTDPKALFDEAMDAVAGGKNQKAARLLLKITAPGEAKTQNYPEIAGKAHNQLGLMRLSEARFLEAAEHFRSACEILPSDPVVEMNYGVALLCREDYRKAIKILEKLAGKNPENTRLWFHLGEAYARSDQPRKALGAFEKFLEKEPGNPDAQLEKGLCLEKLGEKEKAGALLKGLREKEPELYIKYYQAAEGLMAQEQTGPATRALERAARILPEDPIPHHMCAIKYQDIGNKEAAEKLLKKSLEITPTPQSYGQLAGLYEKSNQLNDAWATAKLGLRLFPEDPHLSLTLAKVERRAKKFDQALTRLLKIVEATDDKKLITQIHFQLGWLYDQQGEFQKAFDYYALAKEEAAKSAEAEGIDKNLSFEYIEAMKALDLEKLPASPFQAPREGPENIAFLIGFPRSGTTLLNQILDSHPRLVALEEKPTLAAPAALVEELDGGYPKALGALDEKTIALMRRVYFDRLKTFCNFNNDSIVVDKLPLNLVHLPLIWTLFPKAKIILALRHPMGCALSNFMHNFKLNNAMANMFSLKDITTYYVAVMGLWQHFTENRKFEYHPIRYEDVVTNLETEAEKLCRYLEVEWSPEMLNYSKHARQKGLINTPSYHQVVQPLYQDSLERWRRYEKFLTPFAKKLEPFCKTFKYKL